MACLILASSSPRRVTLLRQAGFDFDQVTPALDETPAPGEAPAALVQRLALAKAAAVAMPSGKLVLAADTVVALAGVPLGKPQGREHGLAMLAALSGRTHSVLTGFAVAAGQASSSQVVETQVTFRCLTHREIANYWATGEPQDKAGAYGIQGLGRSLVKSWRGSYTNVMGLPMEAVTAELARHGVTGRSSLASC